MKIGIISDSHDNLTNLGMVIERLKEEKVETVIHCGDFCAPFVAVLLKDLQVPVHAVFGNVDGDRFRMMTMKPENLTIHGDFAELELGGRKIAVVHYPEIARPVALSNQYDVVCYGHAHVASNTRIGKTILINPGEITNLKGKPSYAIYDSERREAIIKALTE